MIVLFTSVSGLLRNNVTTQGGSGSPRQRRKSSLNISNPHVCEAYTIRGRGLFQQGEFKDAEKTLKEALRLNPDEAEAKSAFKRCRKVSRLVSEARAKATARTFDDAIVAYTAALTVKPTLPPHAPLSSELHAERANAWLRSTTSPSVSASSKSVGTDKNRMAMKKSERYAKCLKDCAVALYTKDDCERAWLTKLYCLHAIGRHDEALRETEGLMQRWGSGNSKIQQAYQRAQFEVRKAARVDYYALLEVPSIASEMEIKTAYKKQALIWHPDRWQGKKHDVDNNNNNFANNSSETGDGAEHLKSPAKDEKTPEHEECEGVVVDEIDPAERERVEEMNAEREKRQLAANKAAEEKQRREMATAEARFKLIGEALGMLTDPSKRKLYDEGHDKEAIEERVAAGERAARNHKYSNKSGGCCGGGGCH